MAKVAPLPRSIFAPPPPPSPVNKRVARALVAPPNENLRKYGFQTASMIENAKTASVPPVPRGPSAAPLEKSITQRKQIGNKPYYRGQQPYAHSATGQAIYRDPGEKAPSVEALTGKTFFDPVLAPAANPRVAALESVLGGVTGLPAIVGAVRNRNVKSAAAQAALFTPVGKIGEVLRTGDELAQLVRAARSAGYVKGSGREAFSLALREVAPNKAAAATALKQADVLVHQAVMKLPPGERAVAAQELFDQMRHTVPSRPIPDFERVVTPTEAATHLRSVMDPKNVQPPKSVVLPSMHPEANNYQVVGDITPQEWWARTQHAVGYDSAVGLKLAGWYGEIAPMIQHFFGEDANSILRGFAVSQANASPAGGLTNVLRVRDKLLRGEPIAANEISTVVKSIEQAYQGDPVTSGLQAKLHDFSDALEGKTTRTWTGNDIRGGAPTPTDIHALRDLGYLDPKILRVLRDRHGLPVAHLQLDVLEKELARLKTTKKLSEAERPAALAAQRKTIAAFKKKNADAIKQGRASGLALDSTGVAGTRQYNHAVAKYQAITDHLNEIQAWGKSDWTPAEVQALGWSAIQRFHGVVPEDAQFMIDRNTTSIAFEVLNGKTGIGDGLSPAAQYAVTKDVADAIVPRVLAAEGVIVRDPLAYGLGGWENSVSPGAYIRVLASPEQVDRVVARLANLFHQYDVWGVRTGVSISKRPGAGIGRAALEIYGPDFANPKTVEKFWEALRARVPEKLQKNFKGFSSYTHADGTPGIRIITETLPVTKAKSGAWRDQYNDFIEGAAEDAGFSDHLGYDSTNVEVRDAVQAKNRTRGASRVSERGRVGDPLAAEAQSRLAEAVSRYSGPAENLKRELPSGGPPHPGVFFHDPHGLEQGIPVHFPPERPRAPAAEPPVTTPLAASEGAFARLGPVGPQTMATAIEDALQGAPGALREQQALYSAENAKRIGDWASAAQADPTEAGLAEASRLLAGKYPRLHWGGFEEFNAEAADMMRKHIIDHPDLLEWQKKRATDAITKIRRGVVPTRSEQKVLRKAFGFDTTRQLIESVSWFRKMKAHLYDVLNIPRSVMASFDVSGAGRQGLMVATQHPALWARNLPGMFKALASPEYFQQEMAALHARPNAAPGGIYDQMGIDLTDLSGRGSTAVREEAFATPLADKIPGVGASSRAYTLFLDKIRADLADYMYAKAQKNAGKLIRRVEIRGGRPQVVRKAIDPHDPELLHSIGDVVNSSSGRGDLGEGVIGRSADGINLLLFSPRLAKSRIDFLNPVWYARLHPLARHQAYKAMGGLIGMMALTLTIAREAGAKVELDPRSSDFAKIKIGNTRIDLAGGFQQYFHVLSEIALQSTKKTSTGNIVPLVGLGGAKPGFGKASDLSVLMNFLRGKLAPMASLVTDVAGGQTSIGQPLNWKNTALSRLTPLVGQDVWDVAQQTNKSTGSPQTAALAAFVAALLGASGAGVQSYVPQKPKSSGGGWTIPSGGGSSGWKMP